MDLFVDLREKERGFYRFCEYCISFYNTDSGVYKLYQNGDISSPICSEDIIAACKLYLFEAAMSENRVMCGGLDSLDRERVRELLEKAGFVELKENEEDSLDEDAAKIIAAKLWGLYKYRFLAYLEKRGLERYIIEQLEKIDIRALEYTPTGGGCYCLALETDDTVLSIGDSAEYATLDSWCFELRDLNAEELYSWYIYDGKEYDNMA